MSGVFGPKVILVLFNDHHLVEPLLDRAVAIAKPMGARLIALHVRPDPANLLAQADGQYFSTLSSSIFEAIDKDARASAAAILALVEAWCARTSIPCVIGDDPSATGVSLFWRDTMALVEHAIVREGQAADLIVIGRGDPNISPLDEVAIEAALFGSGRPVLLVPTNEVAATSTTAMIAWNGSLESARAVAAAMPYLARMDKLDIVTIAPEGPSQPDARDLLSYFAAHGLKAEAHNVREHNLPTGKALRELTERFGAGLVVMGAYTHSRVRELFLGGATREALRSAKVPVLMAH